MNQNYAGDKYLVGFKIEELLEIEAVVKLELKPDYETLMKVPGKLLGVKRPAKSLKFS